MSNQITAVRYWRRDREIIKPPGLHQKFCDSFHPSALKSHMCPEFQRTTFKQQMVFLY